MKANPNNKFKAFSKAKAMNKNQKNQLGKIVFYEFETKDQSYPLCMCHGMFVTGHIRLYGFAEFGVQKMKKNWGQKNEENIDPILNFY